MQNGVYIGLKASDKLLLDEINQEIRSEVKEDMPEQAQIAKLTAKYGNADREVDQVL
jgi:hypothetical protein